MQSDLQLVESFTDPIKAIGNQILAENKNKDVAAPWLAREVIRRYQAMCPDKLDENLVRYCLQGGVSGKALTWLKRPITLPGFDGGKVPERLKINGSYRPTRNLTPSEIRENTRSKRKAIAADVARVKPLERLADTVEAAGMLTVGEVFIEDEAETGVPA